MLPKISHMFRLAKDPDLRFAPSGLEVCKLYLVASEKYKEKETQLWIGATAFGKTAEFIAKIKKGQRVFCTGKIQSEEWEKDGQKQSKISMIIDSFEYVEPNQQQAPQQRAPQQQNQGYQTPKNPTYERAEPQTSGGMTAGADEFDEDIPF